ncbi:hypothetical protein [Flavobacterium litorale]|uniref:Uncharacterized protein n=1 Tax=Flavobacterium litorale TaxID=2856519 RepID=A0ABX8V8P6_9FLAO|nr:hypothetical protein [Flavobacterium litorale]QYJ69225.1 hypothetical protein K1I41_04865 [Flavobacterium litorale]
MLTLNKYNKWAACKKWNLNYIKEIAGNNIVPLYDDKPVSYKDGFNDAHTKMKLGNYVNYYNKNLPITTYFYIT